MWISGRHGLEPRCKPVLTALLPFVYSTLVPDYVLVLVLSGLQLIKAALLCFA